MVEWKAVYDLMNAVVLSPWSSRLVVSVSVAEEPASITGLPPSHDSSIF